MVCREDCSDRPRTQDRKGRYYCKPCYERALKRYREKQATAARRQRQEPGAVCPSCDRPLPAGSKICVECGINVETGRSIVTSRGLDEDTIYGIAEQILRWVSWLTPIGTFPIASEAMGSRRPYTTWVIAALTVIVGIWFWLSTDAQMDSRKNLMLWEGNAAPGAELIMMYYEWTDRGDARAFEAEMVRLQSRPDDDRQPLLDELVVEANGALTPAQQPIGRFHWYQLLTHALLHGDIIHLAGNLLFLLILGARVNALVGNIGTETGVAHGTHPGGFICGVANALILLVSRLLNAGAGGVVSVVLGRHAWAVIGRPGEKDRLGLRLSGL